MERSGQTRCGRALGHAVALVLALCILLAARTSAMEFEMQSQIKCVYEEINNNVIVVGEYKAYHKEVAGTPQLVDVKAGPPRRFPLAPQCKPRHHSSCRPLTCLVWPG